MRHAIRIASLERRMEAAQGQAMDVEANRAHIIEVREAAANTSRPQSNQVPSADRDAPVLMGGDSAGEGNNPAGTEEDPVDVEDEHVAEEGAPANNSSITR